MPKLKIGGQVLYSDMRTVAKNATVRVYDLDQGGNGNDEIFSGNTNNDGKFSGLSKDWLDKNTIKIPTPFGTLNQEIPDTLLLEFRVNADGRTHKGPYFHTVDYSSMPIVLPFPPPTQERDETVTNIICFSGVSTNTEVLAIADRVFDAVRISIQRAGNALYSISSARLPEKGIERDAFEFLKKYQSVNRASVSRLVGLSRTTSIRRPVVNPIFLGVPQNPNLAMASLDFSSSKTVMEQAISANYFDGLKLSTQTLADGKWDQSKKQLVISENRGVYAKRLVKALAFPHILSETSENIVPVTSAAKAKELHLKLASLKAVRRFGWEVTDWGDDYIVCGGDALDSTEQHVKVPQFFVNTFKQDGENFNIEPDTTFAKFDLNRPGLWPRAFMANVFLAEKDADGGFIEFLQQLWEAIGKEVVKLATDLALIAIGAGIGAAALSEFPIIGTIVGAVIGAVIGMLVSWILDSLKDDIFESRENPLGVVLPSQESLFAGNSENSATYTQDFTLGSSRYLMRYYWKLVF